MDREQIQARLAELWKQHLPEISERVGVLERACSTLEAEKLPAEERQAAVAAAHKLAGVLGTFGRTRGTELAREVEGQLEDATARSAGELKARIAQLRAIISD